MKKLEEIKHKLKLNQINAITRNLKIEKQALESSSNEALIESKYRIEESKALSSQNETRIRNSGTSQ